MWIRIRNTGKKASYFWALMLRIRFAAVLRSRDILVWIRIRGSVPLADRSGSDSGSCHSRQRRL
jgi:hypothetical protein